MPRYFGQGQLIDIWKSTAPHTWQAPRMYSVGSSVCWAVSALGFHSDRNAVGQVEQKAPLSCQWAGTHAWRAVTNDKHRKGQKVSLVELERRGERMARQPVTQQGCAEMMVGATRTSWGVLQVSQEQLLTVFACFCNF